MVVTPGIASMKVSWSAPADTGTFGIGGYEVYLGDLNPDPNAQSGGGSGCFVTWPLSP